VKGTGLRAENSVDGRRGPVKVGTGVGVREGPWNRSASLSVKEKKKNTKKIGWNPKRGSKKGKVPRTLATNEALKRKQGTLQGCGNLGGDARVERGASSKKGEIGGKARKEAM